MKEKKQEGEKGGREDEKTSQGSDSVLLLMPAGVQSVLMILAYWYITE